MTRKNRRNDRNENKRVETPNYLGQHLMHNKKTLNEIINQAKIRKHETVIDLGAGKGALTTLLCERAKKVLAVEYDRNYVDFLERKLAKYSNSRILHKNILTMNFPSGPFIVVANIPYSITTSIMKKLLNNPKSGFQRGVIVMEKGAAKRFTSSTIKDPYVIAWRMWFDIRFVKGISRNNFSPPPRVDSAMITITRKEKPIVPTSHYLSFWGLIEAMFQNPQMPAEFVLRNVFTVPQMKHVRRGLKITTETPVSQLTERQWGIVYEAMIRHVPKYRWPRAKRANSFSG